VTAQLPGNTAAIDGEIRRLDDLKERLWSTGEAIRRLSIERWSGRARDAFDEFRFAFANRWLAAGDQHEDAARALERYYRTLLDLRRRVATAEPTAADLVRWRQQLDSEAAGAAAAIRLATHALADMPRLLQAPPPVPPQARRPDPAPSRRDLDPRTARTDPAGFRDGVRQLCDQLTSAQVIVVAPR
jgi:hypothetical protein